MSGMRIRMSGLLTLLAAWFLTAAVAQDFQPLRHADDALQVDLAVGLWAFPLPMDYDGDGDYDLVVACPDKPANGVYFFENTEGEVKLPVFKPGELLGPARHFMRPSYVEGEVHIMASGLRFPNFRETGFAETKKVFPDGNIHPNRVRQNAWSYVDYDGDGLQDLVVGVGDWTDYGWDAAYDRRGKWQNGPLHGLVYWMRNHGTADAPFYGSPMPVLAGGVPVDVYGWPSPNFADFDGDGDYDLLCGEFLDGFTYFENTGSRRESRYGTGRRLRYEGEPLIMDLQMIVPVAMDWDKDGDVDLIVGDEDGRVALIEHSGEMAAGLPAFLPPVYFQQQADTLNAGALATPVSFDWDGDGDEDLLVGNTAGYILLFENLDGGYPPRWSAPTRLEAGGKTIRIQAGPNGSIQGPCEAKWGYTTLSVADWDHDGLPDIIANSIWGEVVWFRNVGTRSAPRLALAELVTVAWEGRPQKPAWFWWEPRANQLVTQWRTTPVAVDWDGDGLTDLIMLDHEGYLCRYDRARRGDAVVLLPPKRAFVDENLEPIRLSHRSAGGSGRIKLCVADWDDDGRLDVLVNSENALFYRNARENGGRIVLQRIGNLGKQNLAGHTSSPTVCDWDGDGRWDLLVGTESGMIYHLPREQTTSFDPVELDLPASPEETAAMEETFIFETAPFPQCHASTIAETPRGLAAAWFGGPREKHEDVCIWTSYHDGTTWSRPQQAASGEQYEDHRHPCWNPVLHQADEGPLLLFYKVGPDPKSWWGMLSVSHDGGRTWQPGRRLPEGIDGPVKNKPFVLEDGSLLCPSSTEDQGWRVHFERTTDLGRTWERFGPINDGQTFSAIQPSILQHDDGRLQILCRSRQGSVVTSFSEDRGRTWAPLQATMLPNPSAGTDALTLRDGRHLIVYNPLTRGRGKLHLAQSTEGLHWEDIHVLEDESGEEFSYPAIIQAKDGTIHITYTWKRKRIKHVKLHLDRLLAGREE